MRISNTKWHFKYGLIDVCQMRSRVLQHIRILGPLLAS